MRLFWLAFTVIILVFLFMILGEGGSSADFSHDNLARLSYLGLWGLVLASGLLGSGLRLGEFVHYGLIWCVVIFALLIGYHHRYQLQDMGAQLTMGLVPSSPLARTQDNSANITLRRSRNGHFETQALVNYQAQIYFMIDTGASSVVLSYEDANRLGLDMEALRFSIPTHTANGEAHTASIRLQSLKIGEIERQNIRALVAQPQALSDSLLGMNFLNSLSGYQVRADTLTLID